MTAEQEWEPGDPLYDESKRASWAGYLYGFRPTLPDNPDAPCLCPDRASWPEPVFAYSLDRYRDEITGERFNG